MTFTAADMTARIARRIAQAREEEGLSQDRLGELLDPPVRHNEISRWEHGEHRPRERTLLQLAEILHRDPGWFFSENGDGTP